MNRRFVNLLVTKFTGRRPVFNLHRIYPVNLFHPAGSPKPADPAPIAESAPAPGRLPPAAVSFDCPCSRNQGGWINFMALKDDIIAADHEGRTLLYDSALRAIRVLSSILYPRPRSISFTVGNGFYVLAREPGRSRQVHTFQALSLKDWRWCRVQPLPFGTVEINRDPSYFAYELGLEEADDPYELGAYTVVGDSQIWISTVGAGTYCFDTAGNIDTGGRWSKIGYWALPFRGRAEYVPEHRLWFGFCGKDEDLCAADLEQEPPVLPCRTFPMRKVWEGQPPPEGWTLTASHLLPLGSGKLCVSKFFRRTEGEKLQLSDHMQEKVDSYVVLAGVEIVKDAGTGSLHVIRHKSVRYNIGEDVKPL